NPVVYTEKQVISGSRILSDGLPGKSFTNSSPLPRGGVRVGLPFSSRESQDGLMFWDFLP
ncbi:MAG: hypothetical protein ACI350_04595, partial [Prevotella sp.]